MKLNIDLDAIENLIHEELNDIFCGPFLDSETAIGEVCGVQIKLVVTREEDDFIEQSDIYQYITEADEE